MKAQKEVKYLLDDALMGYLGRIDPTVITNPTSGAPGSDVIIGNTYRKYLPYDIEIKHHKTITALKPLKQSISRVLEQYNKDKTILEPIAFVRENRDNWAVIMTADHFFELLLCYWKCGAGNE